jgi:hypothetical protein
MPEEIERPDLELPELDSQTRLNLETARIPWTELQRFFARGVVNIVDADLDLVETAARCVENDSQTIQQLLEKGGVRQAEIEDARRWNESQSELWAVVVAPWVLVQEGK